MLRTTSVDTAAKALSTSKTWAYLKTLDELGGCKALERDAVDLLEERVLGYGTAGGEEVVDFLSAARSLELLSAKQTLLELLEALAGLDKLFSTPPIPSTIALELSALLCEVDLQL